MDGTLKHPHRETLESIFRHSTGHNIEWHRVLALLTAAGSTVEEHNGKLSMTIGRATEVVVPPTGNDIDQQMIVDLRRLFRNAGIELRQSCAKHAQARSFGRRCRWLDSLNQLLTSKGGRERVRARDGVVYHTY